MNKIDQLFRDKKNVLSVYFTAGYPALEDTGLVLSELERSGVDLVEIGFPFSDPLADGPTIQQSSEKALENGMTVRHLFEQLRKVKFGVPAILMGYLNPVLQFGVERFCEEASACGISGVILPDLPMDVYLKEYRSIFEKHDLRNIFLITPQTPEARIRQIDQASKGFIYMVSSYSTTGAKTGISDFQIDYFKRIQSMNLKNPLMVGFGIADKASFQTACQYASGAIIGSAFIKAISSPGDLKTNIHSFIKSIR